MSRFEVGFIGFGEAAQAFVSGWRNESDRLAIGAYDILFEAPDNAKRKRSECAELGVEPVASARELAIGSALVVAAVTPDQVIPAALSVSEHLQAEAAYLDINSASPEKKRRAAEILASHCQGYVDIAVLAPVHPRLHRTPLLIGGPGVERSEPFLIRMGMDYEIVSDEVGIASLVKMLRSIFVKGMESVTFECALAAHRAGLTDRIFPSLANALRFTEMKEQADYMMERVAVHGTRRSAEMREVVDTLQELGLPAWMAEASACQQQAIGLLALDDRFPDGVPTDAAAIAAAVLATRAESNASTKETPALKPDARAKPEPRAE